MAADVYFIPGQTEGKRKVSYNLYGEGIMVTIIVFMMLFLLEEIGNILAIFINKLISFYFS